MTVLFSINKTNPLRANIILTMAKISDEVCSIVIMRNLMCLFFASPNEPIFQSECGSFDKKIISSALNKTMIRSECLENKHGYSFHKDAKKSPKTIKLTRAEIQILERWNSTIYKMYVNKNFFRLFDMSRQFQKTCSKVV